MDLCLVWGGAAGDERGVVQRRVRLFYSLT